jgi:O-antigen/teichoic acid export membrane protein
LNNGLDFVLGRYGDVLLLGVFAVGTVGIAAYDVGYSLMQVAGLILTVGISGVFISTLTSRFAESAESADSLYASAVRIISVMQIPLFALLCFHADEMISLLYSDRYAAAVPLVQGFAVFRIVARLFGGGENADYLLAIGKPDRLIRCTAAAALTNLLLDIVLIPLFGPAGAVIATGLGAIVASGSSHLVLRRERGIRLSVGAWAAVSIVCLSLSALSRVAAGLSPWASLGLAGATCFGGTIWVVAWSGAFPSEDRLHFNRIIHSLESLCPSAGTNVRR